MTKRVFGAPIKRREDPELLRGDARFVGRGTVFTAGKPLRAGPRTVLVGPQEMSVACAPARAKRCAVVVKRVGLQWRYRVLKPVIFDTFDNPRRRVTVAIVASPSLAFTVQGCGLLRLRGKGTYTIGSGTPVHYRSATPITVPTCPLSRAIAAAR